MAIRTNGTYDLVLKGGRVIDPGRALDATMDVAVRDGKIAAVKASIPSGKAKQTMNVAGKLVFPGLIDVHAHVYEYVTGPFGINPDLAGVRSGATVVVDQGTASAFNFAGFRKFIVEQAATRVYLFVTIYSHGAVYGYLNPGVIAPRMIDPDVVVETIKANRDVIKGVKIQVEAGTWSHWRTETLKLAKQAAREANVPVYCHLGHIFPMKKNVSIDPAELVAESLAMLDRGDIIAHPFSRDPGCFLDDNGKVYPAVRAAIKRGVLVDVGRGTHFNFATVRSVLDQGILPHTLGIDLHGSNYRPNVLLNSRAKFIKAGVAKSKARSRQPTNVLSLSLAHAMTEMLAFGVPLAEIVPMVTVNGAKMIGLEKEHGTLRVGRTADVTVMDLEDGHWTLRDFSGDALPASQRFVPDFVLRAGVRYESDVRVAPIYEEPATPLMAAE